MPDTKQPVVNDVSAPSIAKHSGGLAGEAENTPVVAEEIKPVSNVGANIAPLDTTLQASTNESATPPEAAKPAEETTPTAEEQEQTEEPKEQKTGPLSPYEAVDSLPDLSEKKTTELTDTMDSPRIYDTKEYVVPIKDTMHSHGGLGKIIAGIVSAIVVVGGIVAAAYFLV